MKLLKPLFTILLLFSVLTLSAQTGNGDDIKPNRKPATTTKPAAKPPQKPAAKPSQKPSAKPSTKPSQKPAAKPRANSNSGTQASSSSSSSNKKTIIDNLVNNMVYVAGGTFTMGATSEQGSDVYVYGNEKPTHQVTLSSFYIGKYEVTQEEWQAVMGSNPSNFKGAKRPVEQVSWDDCQEFIRKLNSMTGKNFRLPTEAEWEFAARGGNSSRGYKYAGGNDIGSVAWYDDNSGSTTHNVGGKQSNELGLYDMAGNVWEWCSDWYGSYSSSSQSNPKGASSGSDRVNRGGGWDDFAWRCRLSSRHYDAPDYWINYLGLRLAY